MFRIEYLQRVYVQGFSDPKRNTQDIQFSGCNINNLLAEIQVKYPLTSFFSWARSRSLNSSNSFLLNSFSLHSNILLSDVTSVCSALISSSLFFRSAWRISKNEGSKGRDFNNGRQIASAEPLCLLIRKEIDCS